MRKRPPARVSSVLQKAGNWEDFPILFIGVCATVGAHWLWGMTGMGRNTTRNSDTGVGEVEIIEGGRDMALGIQWGAKKGKEIRIYSVVS